MRARLAYPMVLLALASCKGRALAEAPDTGAAASASTSSAPAPSFSGLTPRAGAAEQVPGQDNRFYLDGERFSVLFPVFPIAQFKPPMTTMLEATAPSGSGYAAICVPTVKKAADVFPEARAKATANGKLVSEAHPTFPGGDAYEVHVKLDDGGMRVMRFVIYSARLCTMSAELGPSETEDKATDFVGSFRREPAP
jgi:hypothetical protein